MLFTCFILSDGSGYQISFLQLLLEFAFPTILAALLGFCFANRVSKKEKHLDLINETINSLRNDYFAFYESVGKIATFTKDTAEKLKNKEIQLPASNFKEFQSFYLTSSLSSASFIFTANDLDNQFDHKKLNECLNAIIDTMSIKNEKILKIAKIFFNKSGCLSEKDFKEIAENQVKISTNHQHLSDAIYLLRNLPVK